MLIDGPHFQQVEEAEVEEVRAVMGKSLQMEQGHHCSWSRKVWSDAETECWAGG